MLEIDTPENVPLDAEIAGFGSRCMAAFIDYLIIFALLIVISILLLTAMRDVLPAGNAGIFIFFAVQFIFATFYHLFFEFTWNGQTPGKRWLGLRVVQANGLPVTVSGILIRNLVRAFDFLPIFYSVGLITLFITKDTQRLGDLAAQTVVVRDKKALKLDQVRNEYQVHYQHITRLTPIPSYIQIDNISERERRDIVNYLRRRGEIQQRGYVAALLAKRIADQIGIPDASFDTRSPVNAETFLEHVVRAFEIAEYEARQSQN